VPTRILVRRDTTAGWLKTNPVLEPGEPGYDLTSGHAFWGDGSTRYDALPKTAIAPAGRSFASVDDSTGLFNEHVMDALGGTLIPRSEAVRITAATLPTWARKRQLVELRQAPARILCVGDSTTAGVFSDSYSTAVGTPNQGGPNAYPARLAAYLTARGIPAVVGMAIPGHPGNEDSRWSGGLAYSGGNIGAGAASALSMTNAGLNPALTPGVKADTYVVYFFGDSGTGTISAQATGGTSTTINTTRSAGGIYKATVMAGTASASNVLTLTWSSGSSFILGVEFYDSTNPNVVRVLPAGVGGSQANQWANAASTTSYGGQAFISAVAADLTVISLGINDAAAGRTAAQVLTDVRTLASKAAPSGDVLLMSAFPHSGPTPLDAVNAAFYLSAFPYVDLAFRYGYNMVKWGLMTVDQTHPNALGYGDAALTLSRAL